MIGGQSAITDEALMAQRNAVIYQLKAYRNRQSATPLPAESKATAMAAASTRAAALVPASAPQQQKEAISAASFAMPAAFFAFWPALPPLSSHDHDGA